MTVGNAIHELGEAGWSVCISHVEDKSGGIRVLGLHDPKVWTVKASRIDLVTEVCVVVTGRDAGLRTALEQAVLAARRHT